MRRFIAFMLNASEINEVVLKVLPYVAMLSFLLLNVIVMNVVMQCCYTECLKLTVGHNKPVLLC